ncbi:hypothetical protein DICVIV_05984 [Dictyocaulus viviparus]|uniref:Uncharacterized protein n=1 Tax=Dictyocaulus viviparus TaxID=29172 RepID=A0A0D8XVS0_DICVI|nr:hypothetical protein DICVIV_05984 [Dictyocaulus viviparus]
MYDAHILNECTYKLNGENARLFMNDFLRFGKSCELNRSYNDDIVFFTRRAVYTLEFYGTLSGYACSQPVLYYQCQCPTFCSSYANENDGYDYPYRHRRTRHRVRHHKKKFRFETAEEEDSKERHTSMTAPPRSSTHAWEDEDQWEHKFVTSKPKPSRGSEELPDIDSTEIASEKSRMGIQEKEVQSDRMNTFNGGQQQGHGTSGLGHENGVGGIGVHSGLNIGAPGIGGLGGRGGVFGISSGIGIGVPGVGPIGISSGLGVGR